MVVCYVCVDFTLFLYVLLLFDACFKKGGGRMQKEELEGVQQLLAAQCLCQEVMRSSQELAKS